MHPQQVKGIKSFPLVSGFLLPVSVCLLIYTNMGDLFKAKTIDCIHSNEGCIYHDYDHKLLSSNPNCFTYYLCDFKQ